MGKKNENKKKPELTSTLKPEETVVVSKAALDEILLKLDRLEYAGDKGRLGKYDARFFKKGPNIFTVSLYNGKIITGWRSLKNVSYKDPGTGRLVEDQRYEILFNDNTKLEVQGYEQFSDIRFNERLNVEEISRTQDETGTTIKVKIISQDSDLYGKELTIGAQFVN